jgi:hypothetical protein
MQELTRLEKKWKDMGANVGEVVDSLIVDKFVNYVHTQNEEEEDIMQDFVIDLADSRKASVLYWYDRGEHPDGWVSMQQLQEVLGRFTVMHYLDVKSSSSLEQIRLLVNFVHKGRYEIRPSISGSGYGLFTLQPLNGNKLFRYGGVWVSQYDKEDGTPPRLRSKYMVKPNYTNNKMYKFLNSEWQLDGEIGFKLNQLGRWISYPPDGVEPNVETQVDYSFKKVGDFIKRGMPVNVFVTNGASIHEGEELYISKDKFEEEVNYDDEENVIIDDTTGAMYANHTIIPGEFIELRQMEEKRAQLPKTGGKRKERVGKDINK